MTHPKGTGRGLVTGLLVALLILGLPPLILVHDAYAGGKKLPGSSLANAVLQRDVAQQIAMLEMIFGEGCKKSKIIDTEVIEPPATLNVDPWVERWTVDRCGTRVHYRVELTPSKGGGTDFGVSMIDEADDGGRPEPQEGPR